MKILVTAGTDGIGKQIVDYFAPLSMGISRRNGYDIKNPEDRLRIAQLSLEYDVFFNHAYSRDESQNLLLQVVADRWLQENKKGYIISTGTYGTYFSYDLNSEYLSIKKKLDQISQSYSQKIEAGGIPFRMTLLRPGTLDTSRSRQKAHWRGNGIRGETICELIKFLYALPKDVQISNLVMESIIPR